MRSPLLFITGLLGTLLPLASPAQTAPTSPRFYVGVGANLLANVPFNDRALVPVVPRLFGASLTAGWLFTPRWALQVGFSYHGKNTPNPAGGPTLATKYFLVPALLRYTVTAPATPVQFDVLAGATLVHLKDWDTYSGPSYYTATRVNLTVGPAVRAALSSHLEVTAASLVSMIVGQNYYTFRNRLFLNTSLGLNYKFG
ncbi:MAG: outer membrane beta-barrel protein [Janthinobacterium lividum]